MPNDADVRRRTSLRPVPYAGKLDGTPNFQPSPDGGLVYLSFGTVFNRPGPAFAAAVEGLAALGRPLLVTVGPQGNPEAFGPQPPQVSVARYVPLTEILPACSLVVSHGGSGTFLATLNAGIPQLCIPQGANQFLNAEACQRSGAGLKLLPNNVTADNVREAAQRLLGDPSFTHAAQRLQHEIAEMPSPEEVVPLLEEVAKAT